MVRHVKDHTCGITNIATAEFEKRSYLGIVNAHTGGFCEQMRRTCPTLKPDTIHLWSLRSFNFMTIYRRHPQSSELIVRRKYVKPTNECI
jgi:hypothetical protein